MVEKTITKTYTVCDICEGEFDGIYRTVRYYCRVCQRTFCTNCKPAGGGFFWGWSNETAFHNEVCKLCAQRPEVLEIIKAYLEKYREFSKQEREALAQLPAKEGEKSG